MNQEVTDYINQFKKKAGQEWQVEVCEKLRTMANKTIPNVEERIQYGKPHFMKDGQYAAVMAPAKGWVSFMIFNAQDLEAPKGFFQPGPPERKTVRVLKGEEFDYKLLEKLLKQATNS